MFRREQFEDRELVMLSRFAAKASESLGRDYEEPQDELRTVFQRDRDRIIHSKSFRRLMHKTQVFLSPEGDHYRTRLTHTLEVAQISRTIARALALNEDLTEAIALGHDLGHTPFGHSGEAVLDEIHPGGFHHNRQSLRVVEVLETGNHPYKGMNLTKEVRDGIVHHTGGELPFTLEGQIVKTSDRIAYINHDIDDALRSGVIRTKDLPEDCMEVLGRDHRSRINFLVWDMVTNSDGKDRVELSEKAAHYMNKLRSYMFKNVYHNDEVKAASDLEMAEETIRKLYAYYLERPEEMPAEYLALTQEYGVRESVKDYVAGMTDRYAATLFKNLF